ncbi:hypothetical protein ACFL7D_06475 [candidate division KSB1 bacterium]
MEWLEELDIFSLAFLIPLLYGLWKKITESRTYNDELKVIVNEKASKEYGEDIDMFEDNVVIYDEKPKSAEIT